MDWSQLITAEGKAEAAATELALARKAECRERILAVADETAQMNLAAAAAAGALDETQLQIFRSGVSWIHAMREAQADGNWPDVPPGVAELAAAF
ncbi:hypothetical protein ETW24_19125 [Leisingera sp. NJS204]|nr:hypothetical protein ETW24_19125 [Leisingera sp. NJS204]